MCIRDRWYRLHFIFTYAFVILIIFTYLYMIIKSSRMYREAYGAIAVVILSVLDDADGVEQLREPFEREVFALYGNQHRVCGRKDIHLSLIHIFSCTCGLWLYSCEPSCFVWYGCLFRQPLAA